MSTSRPPIKPLWDPDAEAARRARVVEQTVAWHCKLGLDCDPEIVAADVGDQARPRTLYAAGPEVNARRKASEVEVGDDGAILGVRLHEGDAIERFVKHVRAIGPDAARAIDWGDVPQPPCLPSLVGLSFVGAASAAGDFLERHPEVVAAFNACLGKGSHNTYQVHVPLDAATRRLLADADRRPPDARRRAYAAVESGEVGRLCPDAAAVYGPCEVEGVEPLLAHRADGVVVTTWRGRWGLSDPDAVVAAIERAQRLVSDDDWMRQTAAAAVPPALIDEAIDEATDVVLNDPPLPGEAAAYTRRRLRLHLRHWVGTRGAYWTGDGAPDPVPMEAIAADLSAREPSGRDPAPTAIDFAEFADLLTQRLRSIDPDAAQVTEAEARALFTERQEQIAAWRHAEGLSHEQIVELLPGIRNPKTVQREERKIEALRERILREFLPD